MHPHLAQSVLRGVFHLACLLQGAAGQVKERLDLVSSGRAPPDTRPLLLFPEVSMHAAAQAPSVAFFSEQGRQLQRLSMLQTKQHNFYPA